MSFNSGVLLSIRYCFVSELVLIKYANFYKVLKHAPYSIPFLCFSEINKTESDSYLNNCKFNMFITVALPIQSADSRPSLSFAYRRVPHQVQRRHLLVTESVHSTFVFKNARNSVIHQLGMFINLSIYVNMEPKDNLIL